MIAVLTGDIVASSRVPEDQRAAMLDRLDRAMGSLSPLAQQIFRGDAFQAALAEPARCLDAALQLQLRMEAPDFADGPSRELRLGLGLGEATAPPGEPIGRWSGRAFVQAAGALSGLEGAAGGRRLALRSPWPSLDAELAVELALLDALRRRWTPEQRAAVLGALSGQTQAEQAAALGVTQPAVSQRLRAAGWDALQRLRERVHTQVAAGLDGQLFEEGDL